MTEQAYIRAVQDLYFQMPDTPSRFSRSDRQLAQSLHQRDIPVQIIRSAILLATARRVCRNPNSPPLPQVRSLHYFLPVLDEILCRPLPNGYVQYLESRISQHK
jgi:hypothetical protein